MAALYPAFWALRTCVETKGWRWSWHVSHPPCDWWLSSRWTSFPPITTKSDGIKPHYREQWNTNQLWLIRGRALYVSAQGLLAHWADSRQQKWPIFTLRQIHDQTSKRLFSVVMTMCRVRRQQAWKTRSPAAAISNMFTAWFLIRVCKDEPIWDTARYSICVFKCQFGFKASV